MESSLFRQITELVREHKTAARAMAVFLCLALIVAATTVGVLTYTGQAMTQKVKVLTCPLVVHQHTDECYDPETGELICASADYVVHVHNDDCYDEDGVLVCSLPEIKPHVHEDDCYGDVKVPVCGQEEAKGHEHTESCYDRQRGELICTQQEHTHGPDCFLREEVLTCGKTEQEHIHSDDCYTVTRELTCGQEESEEHTHSDDCYTEVRTLTCDKTTEPHVHGPECYTVNETLICEIPEHTHSDDCYEWTETLICDIPEGQIPEGGHVHTEACFETRRELTCGKLENHTHTDDCYAHDEDGNRIGLPICGKIELLEHVHGEECFTIEERTVEDQKPSTGPFFFQMFETGDVEAVCGKEEHTHDESCLDENGQIVCGKEEHTHEDSCYSVTWEPAGTPAPELVNICGLEEHVHDASCIGEGNELICGKIEHIHDESCLGYAETPEEPVYYCGLAEHTHTDACLDENGQLICGCVEHTHSDDCLVPPPVYYCGLAEHTHTDACLDENGQLICGCVEHTHGKLCTVKDPVFYCGLEEHTHEESCLDANGRTVCGKEEHTHTDECLVPVFTQTAETENIRVTAKYGPEANIPEGAVLKVEPILPEGDTEEAYAKYLEEADKIYSEQKATDEREFFSPLALLNVGFYLADGSEVQPAAPVTVSVQFLDETGAVVGDPVMVIHFADAGTEILNGSALDEEQTSVFTTSSFSAMFIGTDGTAEIANTDTATGNGGGEKEFDHNKYIDYLGDKQNNPDTTVDDASSAITDDLYRLYLDMTGECEPIDLVIVIDRSDSMKEKMNGKTRWQTVYDILEGTKSNGSDGLLYDFLKVNEGKTTNAEKNFVSVVWFAGQFYGRNKNSYGSATNSIAPNDAGEGGVVFGWTSKYTHHEKTNYKIAPYSQNAYSAICTNYVAGMYQADQKLHSLPSGTENHKKVVVFMSDGIPVYYYMAKDMSWTNPGNMHRYGGGYEGYTYVDWSGSSLIKTYAGHSPAKSFYESPYFNETLKIFNGASNSFVTRNPNISFYTVAIDLENEKINGWDRTTLLKDMAASYTGGSMFSATDTAGLKQFLQQIMFPAGVSITDNLSAYVDLYETNPDIRVTATPKNSKKGNEKEKVLWWSSGQLSQTGTIVKGNIGNGDDKVEGYKPEQIVKEVTYDGKTISVHFVDDYCLSKNYTYTLSFNVKLTAKAYDDYAQNMNLKATDAYGGATKGDKGTDYPGNSTSSDRPGFKSNENAYVQYNINGQPGNLPYDDPVVQAWGTTFAFTKNKDEKETVGKTETGDPTPFEGVPFRLERTDSAGNVTFVTAQNTGAGEGYKSQPSGDKTYYLTDKDGTIKFGYLPGGTYKLYELVPEGYEGEGTEKLVLTFTVKKGRITSVEPAVPGVELSSTEGGPVDLATTNSTTNHVYDVKADEVKIHNIPATKTLSAYKVDEEDKALKGATFELYSATGREGGGYDLVELSLGSYTSENDGLLFKDQDFLYGIYALVETTAPDNYEKLNEPVVFQVSKDKVEILSPKGADCEVEPPTAESSDSTFKITIKDDKIQVKAELKKVDGSAGGETKYLEGAEFTLYDGSHSPNRPGEILWEGTSNDNGSFTTDGPDGTTAFPLLEAGKIYYLVETKAPAGYSGLAYTVRLTVQSSGHVEEALVEPKGGNWEPLASGEIVKVEDEKDESGNLVYSVTITISNYNGYELPESGGEGRAPLYAVGFAMIVLSAALLERGRRRRKEERV